MASLNTLRTRFGVVLTIIIGIALLAFVLSLKTEMGFSGNDPKVGSIDGDKIKYSDYLEAYERVRARTGASEGDPRQAEMLSEAAWQELFAEHVLEPGFAAAGLAVGSAERQAMIGGECPSQTFASVFTNPRTGEYDVASVSAFLAQAESDPQARQAWATLCDQAILERQIAKYLGLMRGGVYANALEAKLGAAGTNRTYAGRLAVKRYAEVPDSLFEIPSSEVNAYYRAHKERFRQTPSRTLSYVVFDVDPTEEDMLAIEQEARSAGEAFAAAEDIRAYVRSNRNAEIADRYVSAAALPAEESEVFLADRMYGPVLKNDVWTMGRVYDRIQAPDTLGIRHIVLSYTQEELADSLLAALRDGGDFAQAAMRYSLYDATAANGGEVGNVPFSTLSGPFADALAGARKGDIVKIASGDMIQLMQVYRADRPTTHLRIARVTYPVEASEETRRKVHGEASLFAVDARKGSVEQFGEAASAANEIPRTVTVAQGERRMRGLLESEEIVRWANNAKVGDVSDIFTVGGDYVIAVLSGIDDSRYMPVERAASEIRRILLRDKKYEYIVREMAGTTLEEQAQSLGSEVQSFDELNYASYFVKQAGVEPRLVGAITSTPEEERGQLSAPVKGAMGVYVFVVDEIATDDKQTPEAEQVRLQAMLESSMQQWALPVVEQLADIEDLRPAYF